ncbi:acyltransferase family protein [Micromonospora globbae]|uniref:Acyltransferase n=1 Tax=Micromonospora globbae TaxID=1894969 RepID=A0A420EZK9_9ACTN|nr:acyltransferase [Micromonospora globbae]RKF26162.1 acyltransferase [Micromonospora globbae]
MAIVFGRRESGSPPAALTRDGGSRAAGRLAVIDGLRLAAALMVVMYHYTAYNSGVKGAWGAKPEVTFPQLHQVSAYGFFGVQLFFIISGFVICMSCWGRTPGAFFRSRVTRLYPAYWAAVLITTVVLTLWPTVRTRLSWSDVLLNLTMLQGALDRPAVDAVYWTLWNEALFYLLFSVLVWWGLTLSRTMKFCYAWLIASVLVANSDQQLLRTILQPEYAPFFVAGIALYLIHRFGPDLMLWGLVGASYLLAQFWTVRRVNHVTAKGLTTHLSPVVGVLLITAFFLVMTVIALGWTASIRWRWLTTAGLLTYPLYLLHEYIGWTIIHAVRDVAPRPVVLVAVVLLMLGAAWLLHRLIERPLARMLRNGLAAASTRAGRPDRDEPSPTAPAAPPSPTIETPVPPKDPSMDDTLVLPIQRGPATDEGWSPAAHRPPGAPGTGSSPSVTVQASGHE